MSTSLPVLTDDEQAGLREISRLLAEAYEHYFAYEGHCKSSEGHISLEFGNLWDRPDPEAVRVTGISIYSYVFCTEGRSQSWDSIADALQAVRDWYATEMAYDAFTEEAIADREAGAEMAAKFLGQMKASGRLTVIEVDLPGDDG